MEALLRYIVEHALFLFRGDRFRIVDSAAGESFGNALVVLESQGLRLRLVRDRSRVSWAVQALARSRDEERAWFGLYVVCELVTGEILAGGGTAEENARFLEDHLDAVEAVFAEGRVDGSEREMRRIIARRQRAAWGEARRSS